VIPFFLKSCNEVVQFGGQLVYHVFRIVASGAPYFPCCLYQKSLENVVFSRLLPVLQEHGGIRAKKHRQRTGKMLTFVSKNADAYLVPV
jgi:hypothetical protein